MSLITDIPDFIDSELWQDFEQHRKEIRKPLKPTTKKYILKKLAVMYQSGIDVNKAILQTLENGWQGIFEPAPEKKEPIPKDDMECVRFGAQHGINAKPGESMYNYRQRLTAAL